MFKTLKHDNRVKYIETLVPTSKKYATSPTTVSALPLLWKIISVYSESNLNHKTYSVGNFLILNILVHTVETVI
jgi:hypothetical protein